MTTLIRRQEWGARPRRSAVVGNLSSFTTGHWNGPKVTVNGRTSWDHSHCPRLVRGIQNFHMDGQGWVDIAYNFVVCPHGSIFEGRGFNVCNAANGTNVGNKTSHAVMWLSGQGNPFTEQEKLGFVGATKLISENTAAPYKAIGHRDHKATDCPGDVRYEWIKGSFSSNIPPKVHHPVLKLGSTGPAVKDLQRIIRDKAGGGVSVDGVFGPQTKSRVIDLQRLFGLIQDGVVGPKTWAVLEYLDSK